MDEELQRAANAKLGTGTTFIGQTWGLSETTGAVTAMPKGEMEYVFHDQYFPASTCFCSFLMLLKAS
jgi:hypothetical protein